MSANDGRFLTLLDDDGCPPHGTDCTTCRLFDGQRPAESRVAWARRITSDEPVLPKLQQVIDAYDALSPEQQADWDRRLYLAEDARYAKWPTGRLEGMGF